MKPSTVFPFKIKLFFSECYKWSGYISPWFFFRKKKTISLFVFKLLESVDSIIIVAFLCSDKLDLSVGSPWGHAAITDLVFKQEWEGFPKGLLKAGSHKAINYGVDWGVGIGHAVGPGLDLVHCVVGLVVWIERLEKHKDLDWTPADGKEEDDHHHHLGDFTPDANCSLRQEVDLRRILEQRICS